MFISYLLASLRNAELLDIKIDLLVSEVLGLKHWLYLNVVYIHMHKYVCIQMRTCRYTHRFIETPVLLAMTLMVAFRAITLSDIWFCYAFEQQRNISNYFFL